MYQASWDILIFLNMVILGELQKKFGAYFSHFKP